MKYLVDACLSPVVARDLTAAGFDAAHMLTYLPANALDEAVAELAVSLDAAVISADDDFSRLLALSGAAAPSLVLLRSPDELTPVQQARLLADNLPTAEAELAEGAVVSLSAHHFRVRNLPFR